MGVGLAGPADQGGVPVVQGTHRHDDGDVAVVEGSTRLAQLLPRASDNGRGRRGGRGGAAGATPAETVGVGTGPGAPWSRVVLLVGEQFEQCVRGGRLEAAAQQGPLRGGPGECEVGRPDVRGHLAEQRHVPGNGTGISSRHGAGECEVTLLEVLASAADRSGSSTRDGSSMPASRAAPWPG